MMVNITDMMIMPSEKYRPSKYRGAVCALKMKPMAAPAESMIMHLASF
jgi:hypothetical protein